MGTSRWRPGCASDGCGGSGLKQAVATNRRWSRRCAGDGFIVILFQPAQVRAYAKFILQLAKNDKIDAALIAACTAATKTIREPPDPRLAALAGHLTMIEQITEDIARLKTRRESCRDERIRQCWKEQITRLRLWLVASSSNCSPLSVSTVIWPSGLT